MEGQRYVNFPGWLCSGTDPLTTQHPTNFVHTTREKEALERFFEDVNVRAVMKRADGELAPPFPAAHL